MELSREAIEAFIISELRSFQEDGIIPANTILDATTPLVGAKAVLKSTTLVELLLSLESYVEDEFNKVFDWTSDKAMSANNSPMRNVESLASFAADTAS